ncbi:MAG: hypothetical protein LBS82_02115 [Spirochaetaceae bacterium]|nr:hypothetical protein [Spirochaetaceae bacterium]
MAERECIGIGCATLSTILKASGIVSKKTRRTSGEKRLHRARLPLSGEPVQTDAGLFDWFGIGEQFAPRGFQDDATGEILGLYMTENERLQGCLEAFRPVLVNHGVPAALCADRIGVCFVNNKKIETWTVEERLAGKTLDKTQFGVITDELGTELIPAGSPQAKGRVERLRQTLQDRLTVFFAMNNIKDVGSANAVLPRFASEFNGRFGRRAKTTDETAFAPPPEKHGLDSLLCAKCERTTDNCNSFSFQFLGFTGKKQGSYLPETTKRLLFNCFFASVKSAAKADRG